MTGFPVTRLRRLRRTDTLRALVRETRLSLDDVVMPLFACPGEGVVRPVTGLDGIAQRSVDEIVREAAELASLGVRAVLLFGIPEEKDEEGSGAWDARRDRAAGAPGAAGRGARADARHRRLPLRVHEPRPLRRAPRRRGRERRDARAARPHGREPRRRRRRRRRAERHDGRARRRDPRGPAADADHRLCGQVRVGVLRAVPRGGRVGPVVRRPPRLPDGSAERARGAAGVRARSRRGRRRADGEAGARRTST